MPEFKGAKQTRWTISIVGPLQHCQTLVKLENVRNLLRLKSTRSWLESLYNRSILYNDRTTWYELASSLCLSKSFDGGQAQLVKASRRKRWAWSGQEKKNVGHLCLFQPAKQGSPWLDVNEGAPFPPAILRYFALCLILFLMVKCNNNK